MFAGIVKTVTRKGESHAKISLPGFVHGERFERGSEGRRFKTPSDGRATRQGDGGKLEAFYFGFGGDDFHILMDLPSNVDMAAVALVAQASGAMKSRITVLLTSANRVSQACHRES